MKACSKIISLGLFLVSGGFASAQENQSNQGNPTPVFGYHMKESKADDENLLVKDFDAFIQLASESDIAADPLVSDSIVVSFEIKEPDHFGNVQVEVALVAESNNFLQQIYIYSYAELVSAGAVSGNQVKIKLGGVSGEAQYLVSVLTTSTEGAAFKVLTKTILPQL